MDVQYPLLVVGTAERHIQIFNLTNPSTPYKVSRDVILQLNSLMLVDADNNIPLEVADTCSVVLHQLFK